MHSQQSTAGFLSEALDYMGLPTAGRSNAVGFGDSSAYVCAILLGQAPQCCSRTGGVATNKRILDCTVLCDPSKDRLQFWLPGPGNTQCGLGVHTHQFCETVNWGYGPQIAIALDCTHDCSWRAILSW